MQLEGLRNSRIIDESAYHYQNQKHLLEMNLAGTACVVRLRFFDERATLSWVMSWGWLLKICSLIQNSTNLKGVSLRRVWAEEYGHSSESENPSTMELWASH